MSPRSAPPQELLSRLSNRLRAYRHHAELTQEALAERAGIQVETVSRLENGRQLPSLGMLHRLTGVLGCSFGDLLDAAPPDASPGVDPEVLLQLQTLPPDAQTALAGFLRKLSR